MKKIPTLFRRDPDDMRHVLPEVTPGCEWVLAGEGVPTRKYDGTCVLLDERGEWWARREVKPGKQIPRGFIAVEADESTGKVMGWEPVAQSPFVKFWREAESRGEYRAGTYELLGPKINGDPEGMGLHVLLRHDGAEPLNTDFHDWPQVVDYRHLRGWLLDKPYEGIVWHHPDGRMAKLKRRDFA